MSTFPSGRTPESEVGEIMADIAARFEPVAAWVSDLWVQFESGDPRADERAKDYGEAGQFFADGRRVGGQDAGRCIVLTVAYCVEAKKAWAIGLVADAWAFTVAAARWHGSASALYVVACHSEAEAAAVRSELAANAAAARLENDPMQRDKAASKKLWDQHGAPGGLPEYDQWRRKRPAERRSNASFARFLIDRFGFTNAKTVEGWLTEWR